MHCTISHAILHKHACYTTLRIRLNFLPHLQFLFILREFKRLALGVLDQCFRTNEELTQQLLTYNLENWGGQTCLSLAVAIEYEEFLAHASCQALLTDIWTGAMKNAHRSSIKVRDRDAALTRYRTTAGSAGSAAMLTYSRTFDGARINFVVSKHVIKLRETYIEIAIENRPRSVQNCRCSVNTSKIYHSNNIFCLLFKLRPYRISVKKLVHLQIDVLGWLRP